MAGMSPNDETKDPEGGVFTPVLQVLQRILPDHVVELAASRHVTVREARGARVVLERDVSFFMAQLAEAGRHARHAEALISQLTDEIYERVRPLPLLPEHPFPILRPGAFVAGYGPNALSRAGVGDCGALLMRQRAGGPPQVLTRAMSASAGLSEDLLWAAAQRNLRSLASRLVLQEYDYGVISIEVEGHDWLGGSLLLSRTVLRQALERLDIHRAYVCAPSQISVDLVDADAADALPRIERWMAERLAEARPLSELVFAFDLENGHLAPAYASRGGRLIGPV